MRQRRPKHAEVVVIGYGNTLRGDDGFGPVVAERLQTRLTDERIRIYARQLLTVDLVADLEYSGFCLLIDAATTGPIGALCYREVTPEPTEPATLGHELAAASLIGLTLQLTGHAPRCILLSVAPETMELCQGLSPRVASLVDAAVDELGARIVRYFVESAGGVPR